MRIYADFNGYRASRLDPRQREVALDTFGTLCDLAHAGVVLREGMPLTLYDRSDEAEDLEADGIARWVPASACWIAELEQGALRYVPTRNQLPPDTLVCVRCRTPLKTPEDARRLGPGDVCPSCGEATDRPILPP